MRSFSGGLWDRHRVESLHQRCNLTDVVVGKQTPPSGHGGITDTVLDDPEEFALTPLSPFPMATVHSPRGTSVGKDQDVIPLAHLDVEESPVNIPEIEEIVAVLQVYVETPVRRDLDRVRPAIDSCPVFSRHGSDVDNHRICPPIAAYYYIALFFNDSHISGPKCRFGKQHSRSSLPPTRNAWRDGDTPTSPACTHESGHEQRLSYGGSATGGWATANA
jgi:hypothetical protein